VRVGKPKPPLYILGLDKVGNVVDINLLGRYGQPVLFHISELEFLARDEKDLAEDVVMVPYRVWSNALWKGCE